MDAYDLRDWKPGQPEHPRRVLMRASLDQARRAGDVEVKQLAQSPQATDSSEACNLAKAIALPASPNPIAPAQDWDHANAIYWLRATRAHKEAFARNNEMLPAEATACGAEFEVPRR